MILPIDLPLPGERTVTTAVDLWRVLEGVRINEHSNFAAWKFRFELMPAMGAPSFGRPIGGWMVRLRFTRPDIESGAPGDGAGRWEFIQEGTTESGVVKTAWLLVELIVRHELMEGFQYGGDRIFDPHKTVAQLAQ